MNNTLTINAQLRKNFGTGAARALRNQSMIPAIIYGNKHKNIPISISAQDINLECYKPYFMSKIIHINLDETNYKVLVQSIKFHPIKDLVIHIDFIILGNNTQKIYIPILFKNKENSVGIKRGGYFNTIRRKLLCECDVKNLQNKIELDVSSFSGEKSIKAGDIILPNGVKLLEPKNTVIASIITKKGKSESVEETQTTDSN
ncbi:50S ribosomal protein L25/general stress protein Ctc [Rickettsia endosymbiont of Cardiosporidium cionae]|uniref:50S ribosomal protein L25/general stress protein Ctc n=1 Tax=Rickettsia endosymbiont of Cardiosporidium cionae TaxID=2777155 RepID=UPI001895EAAC|nr:50S ribosomal protein L25/general stress protein Ctc [Rickettsia endosymbiont of Cardiosporidium cionae]KAF8818932.1 50S ribosomal protein L25 [Rickettsia endosymbiont of Cardiosporidium cionae]